METKLKRKYKGFEFEVYVKNEKFKRNIYVKDQYSKDKKKVEEKYYNGCVVAKFENITGKSHCSAEDNFDEKFGIKLAILRCLKNMNISVYNETQKEHQKLSDLIENLDFEIVTINEQINKEIEKNEERLKDGN